MERLLMLLDAHKNKVAPKKQPRKKMVVEEISPDEEPVIAKPKKSTKKERDAEKEREINAKMEQYLKPPAKKKPEPAPASQEATEPAPKEQTKMSEPQPVIQAPPQPVPAQPKASEVQNITAVINEIKATIQPEIDAFKMNQISSFIKSYKNRHI
jgi:hypothetical protein